MKTRFLRLISMLAIVAMTACASDDDSIDDSSSSSSDNNSATTATAEDVLNKVTTNGDITTFNVDINKTSLSEIQKLIKLCKDNKLIAIVEVHDATGSDNIQDLQKAADFWIEMKSALIGNEANVILNIANEWGGAWDSANWAAGYQQVIPKLRNAGIKNTIMVDCAGWGQYPKSIADAGQSVVQADSQNNIVFSIHMYEYAGAYGAVQNNIDSSLNVGAPLCIGEFGIRHVDGPIDYKTIMSYSQSKGVGYLGWSWKGNSDNLAYLDMVQDWAGTQLTEQGNAIIYDQNGIKNTSKRCTVFD